MSKQIAVRLPDELVHFVDDLIADGHARSRAAVVVKALEREQRRRWAERDVQILVREGDDDPDLTALVAHLARRPMNLD